MKHLPIVIAGIALLATACGGKKPGVIDALAAAKDYSSKAADEQKTGQDKWQERKAKGDTMAIPYAQLETYLPDVSGYTKSGGPQGSQVNMPGMGGWSVAEQHYENGDKKLTVSIMDYNAAYQAFVGATAVFKMGLASEDDSKKQGPVDIGVKDVVGYETIYKQNPNADLALIASDRFLIEVQSQGNNDAAFVTTVAKSINLADLASK